MVLDSAGCYRKIKGGVCLKVSCDQVIIRVLVMVVVIIIIENPK